jgi:ABC-type Fe3+-hydroxamate transport system substrate-binding protein
MQKYAKSFVGVLATVVIGGLSACGSSASDTQLVPVTAAIDQEVISQAVPDYLGQDVKTVAAVARVVLTDWKTNGEITPSGAAEGTCGYKSVAATADVLEVFKGTLNVGDKTTVSWVIECPVEVDELFRGEQIIFVDPTVTPDGQSQWSALENSTLAATPAIVGKLRELTAK